MNNNKQQTAVEWLINEIFFSDLKEKFEKQIEQAKEMEKQQIIDAHLTGLIYPLEMEATKQAEQYYNETFNTKKP
jgi:hypothetical protein